jgi:hypothetical protein
MVKKRESGIAYASDRMRPFPLAASPASYSCERIFPSKGSPKKTGRQNNIVAVVKNIASIYKHLNVSNK